MDLWTNGQYGAWVSIGLASFYHTMFWLSRIYYSYWMYDPQSFTASANTYSHWGFAYTINTGMHLLMWMPSLLLWLPTMRNDEQYFYFLVQWLSICHYLTAVRLMVVGTLRMVGYFGDHVTDYNSYEGWDKTHQVSKYHSLNFWDFGAEWGSMATLFGSYSSLASVLAPTYEEAQAT